MGDRALYFERCDRALTSNDLQSRFKSLNVIMQLVAIAITENLSSPTIYSTADLLNNTLVFHITCQF